MIKEDVRKERLIQCPFLVPVVVNFNVDSEPTAYRHP
jgi:hypothetical protein